MTIETDIEQWEHDYLSDFCLNTCTEHCCYDLHIYTSKDSILPKGLLVKQDDPRQGTDYYRIRGWCPFYKISEGVCSEHSNPLRPIACKIYPVSLEPGLVVLQQECYLGRHIEEFMDQAIMIKLNEIANNHGRTLELWTMDKAEKVMRKGHTEIPNWVQKHGWASGLIKLLSGRKEI